MRSPSTTASASATSARTADSSGSTSAISSSFAARGHSSSSGRKTFPSASASSSANRNPARSRCGSSSSAPSERAMRSAVLKPTRGSSMRRYGSCVSTSTTSSPYSRTRRPASPAAIPCANRNVSTSRIDATSRQAAIARSTLRRETARPAFVRTSRSRSGSRSSSEKTRSAPKWSTIAQAKVGPMPGTRIRSQSATPSGERGSEERKDSTANWRPYRACSAYAPAQTSWSPAATCPSGPASVTASPSSLSPRVAVQTANSRSGDTYRGPERERVTSISSSTTIPTIYGACDAFARTPGPPRRARRRRLSLRHAGEIGRADVVRGAAGDGPGAGLRVGHELPGRGHVHAGLLRPERDVRGRDAPAGLRRRPRPRGHDVVLPAGRRRARERPRRAGPAGRLLAGLTRHERDDVAERVRRQRAVGGHERARHPRAAEPVDVERERLPVLDDEACRLHHAADLVEPEVAMREVDVQAAAAEAQRAHEPRPRGVEDAADGVLRAVGGEDQAPARLEHARELAQPRLRVEKVLDDLHAQDAGERAVGERQALEVRAHELDLEAVARGPAGCRHQDPLGDVRSGEPRRPIRQPRDGGEEAAVAAARVEPRVGGEGPRDEIDDPPELPARPGIGQRDRLRVLELRPPLIHLAERVGGSAHPT